MPTTPPLPAFLNPPVTEVVISVQFDPLPKLAVPLLGLLWERFRDQYPSFEQQPPLPPVVERLGVQTSQNQVRIEMGGNLSVRLWFLNSNGDQLVQVQNDRFIRNWRRVPKVVDQQYPRFEQYVLPQFLADYKRFQEFLKSENLGEPVINQVEVSYINAIEMNEVWRSHADLSRMFRGWSGADLLGYPTEGVHLRLHYQLKHGEQFIGRLHAALQSGFKSQEEGAAEDQPVFLLTLTARGRPIGEGDAGMLAFIELAHKEIVLSFDKMTTEEAHAVWQKKPALTH